MIELDKKTEGKVQFLNESHEIEREMTADELKMLHELKPNLDLDGDEYRIYDVNYDVENGIFKIWMTK